MGFARTAFVLFGLASVSLSAGEAFAQYDGGYVRGYDRRDSYERSERPRYEQRGYDRGYDRGYERGRDERRREGYGGYERRQPDFDGPRQGYGAPQRGYDAPQPGYGTQRPAPTYARPNAAANPMAGMSIEEQKRAIKNHRQMQKKAFKQGVIIP